MLDEHAHSTVAKDSSPPLPCSRAEAINTAIGTGLIAHLVVCVASAVLVAATLEEEDHPVVQGIKVAFVLFGVWPFVGFPAAFATGTGVHLMFGPHNKYQSRLVRGVIILYEAAIFGWVVVLSH